MKNTLVAVMGADPDAEDILYRSLKDFPSDKIILIVDKESIQAAQRIRDSLAKFGIAVEHEKVQNTKSMDELFLKIKSIKQMEENRNIVINIDTDYMSSCLALSSAFVNGIQAIGLMEEKLIAYPIMKFSYYTALSEKKLRIMKKIHDNEQYESIQKLGKDLNMNLPLTAYHINGAPGKPGLDQMGLVQTEKKGRSHKIRLTKLGELLMKGAVDYEVGKRTC